MSRCAPSSPQFPQSGSATRAIKRNSGDPRARVAREGSFSASRMHLLGQLSATSQLSRVAPTPLQLPFALLAHARAASRLQQAHRLDRGRPARRASRQARPSHARGRLHRGRAAAPPPRGSRPASPCLPGSASSSPHAATTALTCPGMHRCTSAPHHHATTNASRINVEPVAAGLRVEPRRIVTVCSPAGNAALVHTVRAKRFVAL